MQRIAVAKLLGISERTLSRRVTSNSRLTAAESDRIVRLARVLALAQETLGNRERRAAGFKRPIGRWKATNPLIGWTQILVLAVLNRSLAASNMGSIADAGLAHLQRVICSFRVFRGRRAAF